ncbi:MAG: hypothetical protein AB7E09_07240 [Candidatus Izemoplasmatales bacterium]
MEKDKRELIIDETLTRLRNAFRSTHSIMRGKIDIKETEIPAIYLYEDVERISKQQWNTYICTLPLQIDLYDRSYEEPYLNGNVYLRNLRKALELDRDYNKLVVNYGMVARFIDISIKPLMKASVVYEFEYYEFFNK